jgi:hypothetical protein
LNRCAADRNAQRRRICSGNQLYAILRVDSLRFGPACARIRRDAVEGGRLLLGSDTPFPLGEPDPVGFVERSFGATAPKLAADVLQGNAPDFLRITY